MHFFSKGNLTALRELAMRIAAERVDAQMVNYMRAHAIPGPWPAQDRLLVCLNESPVPSASCAPPAAWPSAPRIPWIALYVRTPHYDSLSDAAKNRIAETLRLAERLEGEVVTHPRRVACGGRRSSPIALKRNVTRILVGRQRAAPCGPGCSARRWRRRLLRKATKFEVTIISPEEEKNRARTIIGGGVLKFAGVGTNTRWRRRACSSAGPSVWCRQILAAAKYISLLFMMAVILVAINNGLWPSLYASFLELFRPITFSSHQQCDLSGFRQRRCVDARSCS